jgi:hypothetical protein
MIEDRESRSSILHSRSSTPIKFATAAVVSAGLVSDFAVAVLVVAAVAPVAVADVVPLAADGPIVLLLLALHDLLLLLLVLRLLLPLGIKIAARIPS